MNYRAARAVRTVRAVRVVPVVRRRDDLAFGGRPPSFPFSRDEAALRFDLTDPRQAGQNETKSIRWIGHFGIFPSSEQQSHSSVLGWHAVTNSNSASVPVWRRIPFRLVPWL